LFAPFKVTVSARVDRFETGFDAGGNLGCGARAGRLKSLVDLGNARTKTLFALDAFFLVNAVGSFGIAEGAIDGGVVLTGTVDLSKRHGVCRKGRDVGVWRVDPVDVHNVLFIQRVEMPYVFVARCIDQAGGRAVHEVAQLRVLVPFVGTRGLLLVHLEHYLAVSLFGAVHRIVSHLSNLAIYTGVGGPDFFRRNCINGAVGVFTS